MIQFIKYAELVVSILLAVVIILQSKGNGLSLTPGSGDFGKFERRGAEKTVHIITICLAVAFVLLATAAFLLG